MATGDLMPQIREMIDRLDANPGSPQRVATIKLDNADAQDVLPVLQDMFAGITSRNDRNNNNSALQSRVTSSANGTSSSGFGSSSSSGGRRTSGGGGGGGLRRLLILQW